MSGLRETLKLAVRSARHGKKSGSSAGTNASDGQNHTSSLECEEVALADTAEEPLSISEQIWNSGYQKLKDSKPQLVSSFEAILFKKTNGVITNQQTLKALINASLEQTERITNSKGKLENVKFIIGTKSVISAGLQASQEATLAWSAACVILELLANVSHEAISNREGIEYVIKRLEFNNKLSVLRLSDDSFAADMKDRITDLYAKILRYLVESVVYLRRRKTVTIAKDAIKRYNWDSLLQDVKNAEKLVESDDAVVKGERNTANLQVLATVARTAEDNECLRQLRVTDPRDDKKRIEEEKGGLLKDAYTWVLSNDEYKSWLNSGSDTPNVLWIRGDPGKGKTMLLCGILNELRDRQPAFFFCQATDLRINSAENVLRGLLYMIADEDATSRVLLLLRNRFDRAGDKLFKDANTWVVLRDLFKDVLHDLGKEILLVIDALDECSDRWKLLELVKTSSKNVKWLISSRNWPEIEEALESSSIIRSLSLELNAQSVSLAVQTFIDIKTNELAKIKQLGIQTADLVRQYLTDHAQKTFLWVAIVVQSLKEKSNKWNILDLLKKFPSGLQAMYTRIATLVEEADEVEILKEIVSIAATVERPLSQLEVINLLNGRVYNQDHLSHIMKQSGFLTAQSSMVTFVHLSAKQFILSSKDIYSSLRTHRLLYTRSIEVLSKTLRRNIYDMTDIGCRVDDLQKDRIDPLAGVVYPCVYWFRHLQMLIRSNDCRMRDEETLQHFIEDKYIYWIEALIWLRAFSYGVSGMNDLKLLLAQNNGSRDVECGLASIRALIHDALRFIMFCLYIDELPLQVYTSALFFSPSASLIRTLFSFEIPSWLTSERPLMTSWSNRGMTYSLPMGSSQSFSLYHGGEKLAIVTDSYVQIRSAKTGALELQIDESLFAAAAFVQDSHHLLTLQKDSGKVIVYDCSTGSRIREMAMDISLSVPAFGPGCMTYGATGGLVVHSYGTCLNCRDCKSGDLLYILNFPTEIEELKFSHEESKLVVGTVGHIYLCIASTGEILLGIGKWDISVLQKLSIAFTPDSHEIFLPHGRHVSILDLETQSKRQIITAPLDIISFHITDHYLFLKLDDDSIILTDLDGVNYHAVTDGLGTCQASSRYVNTYQPTLFTNSLWLISLECYQLIFYDIEEVLDFEKAASNKYPPINTFAISPDGEHVAKSYTDSTIQISRKDLEPQVLKSDFQAVFLSFSYDQRLAVCGEYGKIAIWDIAGIPILLSSLREFDRRRDASEFLVEFSPQGQYATYGGTLVTVHDGQVRTNLRLDDHQVVSVRFSGQHSLAISMKKIGYQSYLIRIWNIENSPYLVYTTWSYTFHGMSFSVDGDLFAYTTFPGLGAKPVFVEVRETKSWSRVDLVQMTSDTIPDLWYSNNMKQFRTPARLIHPDTSCTELLVRGTSVYVGNKFILRLPAEYGSEKFRIRGESLIYQITGGQVRRFEINAEKAIKDLRFSGPSDGSIRTQGRTYEKPAKDNMRSQRKTM